MTRSHRQPSAWVGIISLGLAVALWCSFALTMRGIGGSTLTTMDVAILRFGTPMLLLSSLIPRAVRELRQERVVPVLLVMFGGGLAHFMLSATGGAMTSAALVGILLPGTAPVFVAIIMFLWKKETLSRVRVVALVVIVIGVALAALLTFSSGTSAGILFLLGGGCAWAVFTIGLRLLTLSLTSLTLVVCGPSAVIVGIIVVSGLAPSHLLHGTAGLGDTVTFLLLQGVGTGIVSTFAYAYAVRVLGGASAATWGALSPVLTMLVAVPVFHEPITVGVAVACIVIVGGVLAYSTADRWMWHRP